MPDPAPTAAERLRALLPERPVREGGWVPWQAEASPEPAEAEEPQSLREVVATARVDPRRHGVLALVLVAAVAALVAGVLLLRGRPSEQDVAPPPVTSASSSARASAQVVVDVAGRVRHPGLVRLPAGSRVDDALRAAGGALPGASTDALNLAATLQDGQQVLVGAPAVAPVAGASGALLDLNSATAQDLDALPGVGPVLADRIVAWRTEHGRFGSVDQLREVSGIGEAKYQTLKGKVRV